MIMAGTEWLNCIKQAEKTAFVEDGKLKVHYKFQNGSEMSEEYNLSSNVLIRRAMRKRSELRSTGDWDIEVGDPAVSYAPIDSVGIKEASDNPYVVKRITKTLIEWRIRNLPYPPDTYSVTADPNEKCIVVRTTNKKYFKKIKVPDLERVGLVPDQKSIEFSHKFNTLIITYKKPREVLDMEEKVYQEIKNIQTLNEGNFDCKPS